MRAPLPDTILMTADTVGGVWTYALELTRVLNRYDIQVHLATMGEKLNSSQQQAAQKISSLVIHESSYALEWMDDPWDDVEAAGEWLLGLEQEIQPDLIHLNNYAHGALPWQAPVLVTGHSCVLSWWKAVKKEEAPDTWKTYSERVKEGLQRAGHVTGVTGFLLSCLKRYYGPFSSSGVIYNARDKSRFSPSAKEPLVFSMGRFWDEAKNIHALKAVSSELPWPVYIAGEDRKQQSYDNNIHPLGMIDESEVAGWLSKTSIYVMPARYEPFGLSVLEAALSGCALVLGDIPSLREVWGEAAVYVDPDDPEELKQQTLHLIENTGKRKQMVVKALKRAERYSPEYFAQQYIAVYQQLLQAEQPRLAQSG